MSLSLILLPTAYYADRIDKLLEQTDCTATDFKNLITKSGYLLEKKSQSQKRDIEDNIQKLNEFLTTKQVELHQKLEQKIKKDEESLANLAKYEIDTEAGKKEIEKRKSDYIKALKELDEVVDFYSQIGKQG